MKSWNRLKWELGRKHMLAEIGIITTTLALLAAFYAVVASVQGARTHNDGMIASARNATLLNFALLSIAITALAVAIMTEQYQIGYVWSVTSPDMPDFFRLTALWGSQAGSLLFWNFLMSGFAVAAVLLNWKSHHRLMPGVITVTMAITATFLMLTVFLENPFNRFWIVDGGQTVEAALIPSNSIVPPADMLASSARGLNPLLRHFGMAIHPPMLYLGFIGYIIPFAFAMSALASGELSSNWIKASRRWSLVAWLFLSLGLILGGRWAYDVLGWGGYWGWDPVENAAFLPWLVGTAFLHSVMIQEKRGMLKVWNMFLMIGTFSAVMFATFATRSGLIESVHSFARSEVGLPMFLMWFVITLISVWLVLWRRSRGELRDDHRITSFFSREALFLLNNFVFLALFIAIFWGSFGAPIISELFLDTNITLGVDYFMQVTPPLFALLYILMGVAPLSAWGANSLHRMGHASVVPVVLTLVTLAFFVLGGMGTALALVAYGIVAFAGWVAAYETYRGINARMRAHGETFFQATRAIFSRNPRRYGGYMIHFGVAIIGIGVIGSTLFQVETQQTIGVGDSIAISGYTLTYDAFEGGQVANDGRIMDIANVTVSRNGQDLATLRPRRDFFPNQRDMNTMTIAAAHSTLENDFYVLLVGWEEIGLQFATFKVYVNPLVNLIWWGSFILILGTVISVWSQGVLPAEVRQRTPLRIQGAGASA